MHPEIELPAYRDWNLAAAKLLQGPVYHDDLPAWDALLRFQTPLQNYLIALGLRLVVNEAEGFAFVRQWEAEDDGELPSGYENLPKLFRRTRLSYDATLLCVILRDELRRLEIEDLDGDRCLISTDRLFEIWKSFSTHEADEVRLSRSLETSLSRLEDLKFIRRLDKDANEWEIRRILKARLSVAELEKLKARLLAVQDQKEIEHDHDED